MIRQARASDLASIKALGDSLVVRAGQVRRSGFYEFCPSAEQYATRVHSPFSLVAESALGLEGFCIAFDASFLEHIAQAQDDPVYAHLARQPAPFVYVEQLAVRRQDLVGSRTACTLRDAIIEDCMRMHASMVCVTAHAPWRNEAAVRFIEGSGFGQVSSVRTGTVVLGVYRLNL